MIFSSCFSCWIFIESTNSTTSVHHLSEQCGVDAALLHPCGGPCRPVVGLRVLGFVGHRVCRIWLYGIKARRRRRRAVRSRWQPFPGRPGTPACRSALGRAPGARLRRAQSGHRQRRRAWDHSAVGDGHQAVTIADMVGLLKLGTAIDARRRSAPPATAQLPWPCSSRIDCSSRLRPELVYPRQESLVAYAHGPKPSQANA
jgi:hypothetical protein